MSSNQNQKMEKHTNHLVQKSKKLDKYKISLRSLKLKTNADFWKGKGTQGKSDTTS